MKKHLLFVLVMVFVLVLSSCSIYGPVMTTEPTTEPEAFDISKVVFSKSSVLFNEHDTEQNGLGGFGLNKNMETAEIGGLTFAFDPKISMEERAACIQTTQTVIGEIGTDAQIKINVYQPINYDEIFIKEGSVFLPVQDWTSPEYVAALIYGIFGEYCNYGAVYGYSNYLCSLLYDRPMVLCEEDWGFEGDPNVLDLNLLCFRPEFVAEGDIEEISKLANSFVSEYISTNGEEKFLEILESSGDPQRISVFCDALTSFYSSRNIEHDPSQILYRLGGRTYDYIVKCSYAVMYIEKNWTDMNKDISPLTYDNFLHENYNDTRLYFTTNIAEMEQYRKLFGLYPYNDNLHIYFNNHYGNRSCYLLHIHSISLQNTASFAHEYIHALTYDSNILEAWALEGFAEWFGSYYNHYGNAMSTVDYNSLTKKFFLEFKEKLGREIDKAEDFEEIWNIWTYALEYDDPNDGSGYVPGASFIGYLISRFGEEKVIEIICVTHDFGEYTYEDLVKDWQIFIAENYSDYSKNK